MIPGEISKKIDPHIDIFWPYSGLKRGPNFGQQGSFFIHIWKYLQYGCKASFKVWHQKLSEKMAKKQFRILTYFLLLKIHKKNLKHKINTLVAQFLEKFVVYIQAKYWKIGWKLRGPMARDLWHCQFFLINKTDVERNLRNLPIIMNPKPLKLSNSQN